MLIAQRQQRGSPRRARRPAAGAAGALALVFVALLPTAASAATVEFSASGGTGRVEPPGSSTVPPRDAPSPTPGCDLPQEQGTPACAFELPADGSSAVFGVFAAPGFRITRVEGCDRDNTLDTYGSCSVAGTSEGVRRVTLVLRPVPRLTVDRSRPARPTPAERDQLAFDEFGESRWTSGRCPVLPERVVADLLRIPTPYQQMAKRVGRSVVCGLVWAVRDSEGNLRLGYPSIRVEALRTRSAADARRLDAQDRRPWLRRTSIAGWPARTIGGDRIIKVRAGRVLLRVTTYTTDGARDPRNGRIRFTPTNSYRGGDVRRLTAAIIRRLK